jgi:hypothetical protein
MTARADMTKTSGVSILTAVCMRAIPTLNVLVEDSEPPPMTPRGMAAAPAPRLPVRADGDSTRPATIRIEANGRSVPPSRADLERVLDRTKAPVAARPAPQARELNWLLLSQGLFLNAFVLLLVLGWSAQLPGRSLLLCGLALGGAIVAALVGYALAGAREAKQTAAGRFVLRALPAVFVAGWVTLSLYALGLPPAAKAQEEVHSVPAATPAVAPQVRGYVRGTARQPAQ